ncbi:MAG TPA: sensor histidine kinase [Nocardioidaceae bacterium]|nr:sensor histidine kinase [Nocardioidaceae bacterium]
MRLPVPPVADSLIAGAFVLFTVAEALFSAGVTSPLEHVAVAGIAMVTLAWRRSYPVGVAVWVVATNIVTNPQDQFSTLLSLVLVAYTIGSETERPRSYAGLGIVLVPFVAAMAVQGLEPSDVAAAFVFLVGPWSVGTAVRQRAQHTEEALARADRLERERELQAAVAAAEERTRIARELHDIVSHSISVVTIQTQAVRRRLGPEHAKEATDLAAVEATAREALAEMRRLFGVLRSEGETASLTPQPGLHELDRLVAQVCGSGLEVEVAVQGERYELPPGVDLAAYRIVQEALTNALRHSGANLARVVLRYCPGRLDIVVEDDGRGLASVTTGGHGLVGVRERVALYDGTVNLGPGESGGVRLSASLPVHEAP